MYFDEASNFLNRTWGRKRLCKKLSLKNWILTHCSYVLEKVENFQSEVRAPNLMLVDSSPQMKQLLFLDHVSKISVEKVGERQSWILPRKND